MWNKAGVTASSCGSLSACVAPRSPVPDPELGADDACVRLYILSCPGDPGVLRAVPSGSTDRPTVPSVSVRE